MQKPRTLHPGFLLLGVLSVVFGYEELGSIGVENNGIESVSLEKTCLEYPELFGCENVNSKARSKRSIDEKESKTLETVPSQLYFYEEEIDPENTLEKRYSNYRIRNPETEGYKRGPGFRSWGGKRGGKGSKFSNWGGKRAKFASWGGKRAEPSYKGSKFSNWGGKRSFDEDSSDIFDEDKRAKFQSWGGKRSDEDDLFYDSEDKRAKFGSWGGKRDYDPLEEEKRAKFASWGGKRDFDEEKRAKFGSWGGKRDDVDFDAEKRAKFGSWGGKRDFDEEKRAKFGSWGGKRDDIDLDADKRAKFGSWGGKRDDVDLDAEKRAKFGSWGGKRFYSDDFEDGSEEKRDLEYPMSYDDLETNEISKRPRFANWGGKRASFRSWGGKRSIFGSATMSQKNPFLYIRRGDLRKFLKWGGKRKFSSWGGKRSVPMEEDDITELEKRPSFNSWGGKRDVGSTEAKPPALNSSESSTLLHTTDYKIENLGNELNNTAEENANKEMAALSHVNPYYPIVNKRSYYPGRSIKTLLLNDLYDTRGTDLGVGPRRRSEFFPWGGKRDGNKTLR